MAVDGLRITMDKLRFSDHFLYKKGGRIIHGSVSLGALSEHLARYKFASQFSKNSIILNLACGSGYGSTILLKNAKEIFNVDISEQLVAYGNVKYSRYNNHFLTMDGHKLEFPNKLFNLIVSFETIEHLEHPEIFISECYRVLADDGILILSTPNKVITSPFSHIPSNPDHRFEWDLTELKNNLNNKFEIKETCGQLFIKQKRLSFVGNLHLEFSNIFWKCVPVWVFKLAKQHLLHYQDIQLSESVVRDRESVKHAEEKDFFVNSEDSAYSVMVLVLSKTRNYI